MAFIRKIYLLPTLLSFCLNAFSQSPKPDTIRKANSSVQPPQKTIQRIRFSEFSKTPLSKYYYVYNDDLYKFTGTWEGSKDSIRVKIVFKIKAFRFNSDTTNLSRFELVTGTYQQFTNGKLVVVYCYPEDDFVGSTTTPDILKLELYIWVRKSRENLKASFLPNGKLELAIGEPMFESPRNDKNFELKEPIILTKQN